MFFATLHAFLRVVSHLDRLLCAPAKLPYPTWVSPHISIVPLAGCPAIEGQSVAAGLPKDNAQKKTMARKRKTKKDEDEGALSPRTVLVALLIAAIAAGAAHLLKHPAIVEEWAEASANLNATARARRGARSRSSGAQQEGWRPVHAAGGRSRRIGGGEAAHKPGGGVAAQAHGVVRGS